MGFFDFLRKKKEEEPTERPRPAPRRARAYVSYTYRGPTGKGNPPKDFEYDPWQRDAWREPEE